MKLSNTAAVVGTVRLSEREESQSEPGLLVRKMDDRISFETRHLHEYCYRTPTDLSHDIATLLGAARIADRGFSRHHSKTWCRELHVQMPVYELQTWRKPDVTSTLQDCLQYLTGDRWSFQFVKRRQKSLTTGQIHVVSSPDTPRVFVPFSHGLDSYAQSELLRAAELLEIVPVNINSSRRTGNWKALGRSPRARTRAIPVSSRVDEPHHTEPSFRTRPFIYDLMAAYGAAMSDTKRVLVPENGQGSLGGSLVPLGHEAPHRSCHPGFTLRLARFVESLTGHTVTFEHPGLFQTKGEVLSRLLKVHPNSGEWLSAHPSCSYDSRHAHDSGSKIHCGVCGNCLLRRLSLFSAGINDTTRYRVADLHAPSIAGIFSPAEMPREIGAYKDVAFNSSRSMQRFADLAMAPKALRVWAEIDGVARYQRRPIQEVRDEMFELLAQHHSEWTGFLEHCGKSSWVTRLAKG